MNERDEQVVALMRMFDAYGQVATPSRIDVYLEVVGKIPVAALREGINDAMREAKDFPPGPGTVRTCALAAARMRPGDPPLPELPRDPGFRLGESDRVPAVVSGLEARVERNYANVIRRAAEIRAEHALPETLDARLWSLGKAEAELGWRDQPYACRCNPPCGTRLDRGLKQQRDESERRLREAGYLRDAA